MLAARDSVVAAVVVLAEQAAPADGLRPQQSGKTFSELGQPICWRTLLADSSAGELPDVGVLLGGIDLGEGQLCPLGKRPRSAPGPRWQVAVREALVAAGAGAACRQKLEARRAGQPVLRTENPAAWMQRWWSSPRLRYQVACGSLEPNLGVGGELSGEVGGECPALQCCSWSGFCCATSMGAPVVVRRRTRRSCPTGGWTSVAARRGGGPQRERSG